MFLPINFYNRDFYKFVKTNVYFLRIAKIELFENKFNKSLFI